MNLFTKLSYHIVFSAKHIYDCCRRLRGSIFIPLLPQAHACGYMLEPLSRLTKCSFLIAIILFSSVFADPWGKDADLIRPSLPPSTCSTTSSHSLTSLGIKAIRFHQNVISPADGPRSHYIPSSSQYTLEAMQKYGFFQGFTMGCDRLMRENDEEWVYRKTRDGAGRTLKWDPVP